jgi:hypothetical protein
LEEQDRHLCLALTYHVLGRQVDAEHELEQFKTKYGDTSAYRYAQIYAQWGNAPAALRWLDRVEQIYAYGMTLLKVDPLLDPIRNEPHFKELVARMKFPP